MISLLADLLVQYGPPVLFLTTLLSCLALPIPSTVLMLAAGALTSIGTLPLGPVVLASFMGAVLGDLCGYLLARQAEGWLHARLARKPSAQAVLARAEARLRNNGFWAVFLTRWLISPLGPYVNFASGAARLPLRVFIPGSVTGECFWVAGYVGLGHLFAAHVDILAEVAGSVVMALAALVLLGTLGGFYGRRGLARRREARLTGR